MTPNKRRRPTRTARSGKDAARRTFAWWSVAVAAGSLLGAVVSIVSVATTYEKKIESLRRELNSAQRQVRSLEVELDDLHTMLRRTP